MSVSGHNRLIFHSTPYSSGARYVCKTTENDDGFDGRGLMYEEKAGPNCPVVSFDLNPLNEFLFQRPKRNASTSEDFPYDNLVVGERTLGEKIKKI